jgi:DNA-binding response OmpR family regulator
VAAKKILIAEDDPSVRFTLEFLLQDEGYEVLLAEDGEQAFDLAKAHLPDMILLDHIMPKMDGREVAVALREDPATTSIPILMLSGMGPDRDTAVEGVDYIGKPFSPDELAARLKKALGD